MIIGRRLLALGVTAFALACGGDGGAPAPDSAPDEDAAARDAAAGASADAATTAPDDTLPVIVFLGNSLTAGYGLDPAEAYPALIQERVDSAGYAFRVVNAGVSGETSAGGLRRLDWLLDQPVAVLVLALGGNDALRGHEPDATRRNLGQVLERTRARHADADLVIAGMRAPPNLGRAYAERFDRIFPELGAEHDAALVPFLLEGVAAVPELNQPDRIHPTAAGQRIIAENVWSVLEPILARRAGMRTLIGVNRWTP